MSRRERGAAIILALSVVALAALAASAMMVTQGVWIRQMELSDGRTQGQFLIQAGLDWARAVLNYDRHSNSVDHPGEPWALRLPPIPLENGSLAGYLQDQQARFNLNNLVSNGQVDPAQLATFRRLLSILDLRPVLADMLADRIAADGRPLVDVSELALLSCFDQDTRARLLPFVTALPRFTAVNVNTAAPEVLAALVDGLGLDGARALAVQRERAYFRSTSEFLEQLPRNLSRAGRDHFGAQRLLHGDDRGGHRRRPCARPGAAGARRARRLARRCLAQVPMSLLRIYASLSDPPARCQWALVNHGQEPVAGEGAPAQLPRRAARVQLVVPAAQALLARARLPGAARHRAGAVLAFAVEERIVDEPDASQVSWLGAAGEDDIVAVIDKAGLERWRKALSAAGLRDYEIHCETLLLPWTRSQWSLAWNGREGFVRTGEREGAATDCGERATPPLSLRLWLEAAKARAAMPDSIALYATAPGAEPDVQAWTRELGVAVRLAGAWDWRAAPPEAGVVLAQERQRWQGALRGIAARLRPAAWILAAAAAAARRRAPGRLGHARGRAAGPAPADGVAVPRAVSRCGGGGRSRASDAAQAGRGASCRGRGRRRRFPADDRAGRGGNEGRAGVRFARAVLREAAG